MGGVAPTSAHLGMRLPAPARLDKRRRALSLSPTRQCSGFDHQQRGKEATGGIHAKRWTTWTLDTHPIGVSSDVPATAPQWGRIAPPSPSGTLARITPPPAFAARRNLRAVTIRSTQHIVTILFKKQTAFHAPASVRGGADYGGEYRAVQNTAAWAPYSSAVGGTR